MVFNVLNIISGFLEVGSVVYGMKHFGIYGALIGALCYQLGNLVPSPFTISKRLCNVFMVIAAMGLVVGLHTEEAVLFSVPFLAAVLQNIRSSYKVNINKNDRSADDAKNVRFGKEKKRFVRIIGFVFGFLLNSLTGLLCCVIVGFLVNKSEQSSKNKMQRMKFNVFDYVLLFHEIHYFVYCYCMIAIAYESFGSVMACVMFLMSWLLYVFSPRAYTQIEKLFHGNYIKTFVLGHLVLITILIVIAGHTELPVKLVFWMLTGIGGTTEYCIERIEKQKNMYEKDAHTAAENLGHVGGVALSILLYMYTNNLNNALVAAILCAAAAIVLMIIGNKKGVREYENK
ncbi:MAG: hypothetical protein IJZ55_03875 [Lachnospiraceae bacterium]|nr:hypothetical protein [Lachnospiraceae bacterium]